MDTHLVPPGVAVFGNSGGDSLDGAAGADFRRRGPIGMQRKARGWGAAGDVASGVARGVDELDGEDGDAEESQAVRFRVDAGVGGAHAVQAEATAVAPEESMVLIDGG